MHKCRFTVNDFRARAKELQSNVKIVSSDHCVDQYDAFFMETARGVTEIPSSHRDVSLIMSSLRNNPISKLKVPREIYARADFKSHRSKKPFGTYLSMNLKFEIPQLVRQKTENTERVAGILKAKGMERTGLKHRGEAHITVVTPPEFDRMHACKNEKNEPCITINDIDKIALQYDIQNPDFQPLCVEEATDGKGNYVYYMVVKSEKLEAIRQAILEKFVENGGHPSRFDPDSFYPHVTLGFTGGDLHLSNGVFKSGNACIVPLEVE